ncbi:MAG: hypothetical protein A3E82_00270 [Gammaproteobacteria bacterium RIFCSPHIGHO2_12_FULL_38_11]|nr:MAG: hypothetical protein A3E82_00270 [Gammaproteobacteria bacterium RIFCSPHIGHO2_12_FULL_38_11]
MRNSDPVIDFLLQNLFSEELCHALFEALLENRKAREVHYKTYRMWESDNKARIAISLVMFYFAGGMLLPMHDPKKRSIETAIPSLCFFVLGVILLYTGIRNSINSEDKYLVYRNTKFEFFDKLCQQFSSKTQEQKMIFIKTEMKNHPLRYQQIINVLELVLKERIDIPKELMCSLTGKILTHPTCLVSEETKEKLNTHAMERPEEQTVDNKTTLPYFVVDRIRYTYVDDTEKLSAVRAFLINKITEIVSQLNPTRAVDVIG